MPEQAINTAQLHLFDIQHCGESYFWIAEDLGAAVNAFAKSDEYQGKPFDVLASPVSDGKRIKLREEEGGQLVTRTARQWIEDQGAPGFLASTEG